MSIPTIKEIACCLAALKDEVELLRSQDAQEDLSLATEDGTFRYNRTGWAALSDFTVTGAAPSVVNSAIRLSSAYGSWDTQRVNLSEVNNDRDWTITATVRIRNTTEYGMAFGITSVNTWDAHELAAAFVPSTLSIALYPEFHGANTTPTGSGTMTAVAVNDILRITLTSRRNIVTSVYTNMSTGAQLSASFPVFKDRNTGKPGFASLGSGIDILSFGYRADFRPNPQVIAIGDSKTSGTSLDGYSSWADRLMPERRTRIFAGPSDRTVEAVQCIENYMDSGAKYAVLSIGRNDIASGVSTATWQANHRRMAARLKADGLQVIHLVIPETVQDQSTLTAFLDSEYPDDVREYLSGWVNGTHLGGDGVHPNAVGSAYIASIIETHLTRPTLPLNPTTAAGNRLAGTITRSSLTYLGPVTSYADDTAANADTNLTSGGLYRTTAGGRTLFQKP